MRVLPACFLIFVAAGSAAALTPHPETASLEIRPAHDVSRIVYESARIEDAALEGAASLGNGWVVQPNSRTGTVHFAYGGEVTLGPIPDATAAAQGARGFLLDQAAVTGVRAESLELQNVFPYRGKYAVRYRQVIDGLPVIHSTAFVVLGESGRVVAFGSDFFPEGDGVDVRAALSETEAIETAAGSLGTTPRADRPVTASLALVPAPAGGDTELTVAYRVTFESAEPFGKWESFVDGRTGEILSRTNRYHFLSLSGNVDGGVEDFGYCDGEANLPLANLTVNIGGEGSGVTDENGDFEVTVGPAMEFTVTAELKGPFIDVDFLAAAGDAQFTGTAVPGVPFQITWGQENSKRDERDVFFHGNRVHDFMKAIDPDFTSLDYSMPTTVRNRFGICPGNAWWDGFGMNFCVPGDGYANTGRIGNVVYHEYGHGVSQEWYIANGSDISSGDMHEGNSDIIANFIDRNPIVGLGFFQDDCGTGIRSSANTLQWPEDNNGGHFGGQIIAGFHWDGWQSMLAAMPAAEADEIAWRTWHFGRGMGTPQSQPDQVLWTFLADDDDEDLTNGTPNYEHFCAGAMNHGFECPEITGGLDAPVSGTGSTLALAQNQPNPAGGGTRIEYAVPTRSEVDLRIYNVRGQAVRRLAAGLRDAGSHSALWDGRDTFGERVAAGVYFYRLSVGGDTLTRKMTVMR